MSSQISRNKMKFNSIITILVITLLASGSCVHDQSRDVALNDDVARDDNAEIRRDGAGHFRLRELTNGDLVALRRSWLSDAWEGVKSEVNKVGHKIESGVKKIGDTINSGVDTIKDELIKIASQPVGTHPHPSELRDTGSSDSVDRRAFNPYKFSGVSLRSKKREVAKRISFPYDSYPYRPWLRRSSDAAAEERGTVVRRSYFIDPPDGFSVGLGKGYNNGVVYRDLSLQDQSDDK